MLLGGVDAFFYFYFFDDLYYIEDIQQAFKNICLDKMLSDGYFDMSAYIFGRLKKEDGIQNDIRFSKGVVYNAEKVEIHFLSSVSSVNSHVSSLKKEAGTLFFRGHADPNYILRPSIMRTPRLLQNESEIYHELIINCPDDFEKCHNCISFAHHLLQYSSIIAQQYEFFYCLRKISEGFFLFLSFKTVPRVRWVLEEKTSNPFGQNSGFCQGGIGGKKI